MNKEKPFVTVIMPVHNEAGYIRESLGAVLAQDYPTAKTQVIVVDGLSTDGTREIVQEFHHLYPNLQLMDNPGKIVPKGLNIAIRKARGEVIVRIDGHCKIAEDYISRCVDYIQNHGVDGVGGSLHTVGLTFRAQAIATAMSTPFGVGDSSFRTVVGKTMLTETVPFPAYTREIITRVGLYDEEFVRNQDDEYNYRLIKQNGKLLLAGDVCSKYYSRSSLQSLLQQYFEYGFWKVRVLQKHPLQMRPRQFIPPAFVSSLLGTGLISLFYRPAFWLLFMIASTYLVANLAASFWTAMRKKWIVLPLLPLVYAILHFSYGTGFLAGLFYFANRWGDKAGKVPHSHDLSPFEIHG